MHSLTAITALGGMTPRIDTVGNTTLSENPDIGLASVAARMGREQTCMTHLAALLASDAPGPGQALIGEPETAFWTSPNQWMIAAPFATHEDLAVQLKTRFGDSASITEQTDAWVWFDLHGEGIEDVMELLCAIDIRAMQPGDATRTLIHHLGCFVIRPTLVGGFHILGPRASAGSLHHAILTAMTSAL